ERRAERAHPPADRAAEVARAQLEPLQERRGDGRRGRRPVWRLAARQADRRRLGEDEDAAVRHGQGLVQAEDRRVAEAPEWPLPRAGEERERAVLDQLDPPLGTGGGEFLGRPRKAEVVDEV